MNATVPAKPRLRGVSHQYAAAAAVPMAGVLIAHANGQPSAWLYGICLFFLFAVSATYHRVAGMAATKVLAAHGSFHDLYFHCGQLHTIWLGAPQSRRIGHPNAECHMDHSHSRCCGDRGLAIGPKWFRAILYLTAGWMLAVTFPKTYEHLGGTAIGLILGSGFLYSLGAIIYARKSPNPWPFTFGYHEIFHILVIAAAWMHYAVIYAWLY